MTREEPDELDSAPLAYENTEFLNSPDGRLLRIIAEYQEPMARFRRERIQDTVVFFGSARFRALDVASSELELLANTGSAEPAPHHEQPARPGEIERRAEPAEAEAMEAAGDGSVLARRRRLAGMVSTVADAAGAEAWSVTSEAPGSWRRRIAGWRLEPDDRVEIRCLEQHPNPCITPELNFDFHYFFMRKYWFAHSREGAVVFRAVGRWMMSSADAGADEEAAKKITVVIYGRVLKHVINLELRGEGCDCFGDWSCFSLRIP